MAPLYRGPTVLAVPQPNMNVPSTHCHTIFPSDVRRISMELKLIQSPAGHPARMGPAKSPRRCKPSLIIPLLFTFPFFPISPEEKQKVQKSNSAVTSLSPPSKTQVPPPHIWNKRNISIRFVTKTNSGQLKVPKLHT